MSIVIPYIEVPALTILVKKYTIRGAIIFCPEKNFLML